jgi:transposase-like protein
MEDDIKRWTAKRKTALILDIIQGKTTVAEASRAYDLPPSEIEEWVEDGKKGMENALRTKPLEIPPRVRIVVASIDSENRGR